MPLEMLLFLACVAPPDGILVHDPGVTFDTAAVETLPDASSETDETADLFDPSHVITVDITLPDPSIAALAADGYADVHADITIDGELVRDVGLRLKGEYNYRPLSGKSAFKIDFNAFVDGQHFHGLKKLTLNNAIEDPSFVAERLAYYVFRETGLPASRANSAWVTVNGEAYGLYVNVETVDDVFLARWFGDGDGNLYEETGFDFEPGNAEQFEQEQGEDESHADLANLIAVVDAAGDETFLDDVATVVESDRWLRFCAVEALVNQWDGYCYTLFGPNNFRVYDDPTTGRFSFLPAGLDMSMKSYSADYVALDSPVTLLPTRCLQSAACASAYRDVAEELIDAYVAMDLGTLAEQWYAQIADLAAEDPRRECTEREIARAYADVLATIERREPAAVATLPRESGAR